MTNAPPVMDLDADAAIAPNRLHLGIVGAWMLYPDAETARERYIESYRALHYRDLVESGAVLKITSDSLLRLIDLCLSATPPEQFQELCLDRTRRGHAAGMVAYNATLRAPRGEKAPVTTAIDEIAGALWQGRPKPATKYPQEKVWQRWRPVVAFWGAWTILDYDDADSPIPCWQRDLPRFLAVAEAFRAICETTIPPRRKEPIIPPGEHVRLPEAVVEALPKGRLLTAPK